MTSYQASQRYPRKTQDRGPRSGVGLHDSRRLPRDRRRDPRRHRSRPREDGRRRARRGGDRRRHDRSLRSRRQQREPPAPELRRRDRRTPRSWPWRTSATSAELPPVPEGDLVKVHMALKDMVVEVAPGVKYAAWAFDGHGAPGPIVHAREGQIVEMTLTNGGAIPHSIDFHAARIAPNVAFSDVVPGESFTFRFRAADPGSTCTTAGRSRCSPTSRTACTARSSSTRSDAAAEGRQRVRARRQRVVPDTDGLTEPASSTWPRRTRAARLGTFNGYANQYATHPLTADPGERRASTSSPPGRRHRLPRGRHDLRPGLGEQDMTQFQPERADRARPGRRRRRLRREDRRGGPLPVVSHAFARRRPGPGRDPEGRQPQGPSTH